MRSRGILRFCTVPLIMTKLGHHMPALHALGQISYTALIVPSPRITSPHSSSAQ